MGLASPWTEEVCLFMKANWTKVSRTEMATMINGRFGVYVTRNAVIGKLTRLGLIDKVVDLAAKRTNGSALKQIKARVEKPKAERTAPFRPAKPVEAEPFQAREAHVEPRRIPFMELTEETCKYECTGSNEPRDYLFCGNPTLSGLPYCAGHARLCFMAPGRRARA